MQFRLIQPTPLLSPYIKQYWYLEIAANEGMPQLQRVVPNGFVEMSFHFSEHLLRIKERREMQPGLIISGQKTGFFDVLPTGSTKMLNVQFYPHSAGLFFPFPVSELADLSLSLADIMGMAARELEEQLQEMSTLMERIAHIERFLLQLLAGNTSYRWNRIQHNIGLINISNGLINAAELADASCLSRKQHEREFKKMVGLSPKQYLKVIRFQYTLYAHQQFPGDSLTELAYRCGYFDQSHMINDFRQLSGITPGQYFSECDAPYSDYF
ncbi:MAG: Helix-turn-helix, AraC domain [Bacteroidetes bacterium]|nr:Helix-turn-helix, AraC domain [Bacteroidota bacterium]